jgi:hypothetical protein
MEKNYRAWTPLKRQLNNADGACLFFHEREIWHCHLGENIGFEQDGRGDNGSERADLIRRAAEHHRVPHLSRSANRNAVYVSIESPQRATPSALHHRHGLVARMPRGQFF